MPTMDERWRLIWSCHHQVPQDMHGDWPATPTKEHRRHCRTSSPLLPSSAPHHHRRRYRRCHPMHHRLSPLRHWVADASYATTFIVDKHHELMKDRDFLLWFGEVMFLKGDLPFTTHKLWICIDSRVLKMYGIIAMGEGITVQTKQIKEEMFGLVWFKECTDLVLQCG